MSLKKEKRPTSRPFPWVCPNCGKRTVEPTVMDYTAKVKQDGVIHELYLPQIEVPRCQACGETVITTEVDEKVNDALRAQLRLLTPDQMRQNIEDLDLTQKKLAERLGVAAETISRWLSGAVIQSRAMDNLLRVYFAVPEVRVVLQGAEQDPGLGTKIVWPPDLQRVRREIEETVRRAAGEEITPGAAAAPRPVVEISFRSLRVRELVKQATPPRWSPFAPTDN